MKILFALPILLLTLYSCGDSTNSQIEKLKQENSLLKNSLDSINDYLEHSMVIYQDDIQTHLGVIAVSADTIDSKSNFYLSTYLCIFKLPENCNVKWKINQSDAEVRMTNDIEKHVKFPNLKPGNQTFSGSYQIYLKGKKIKDTPWEREVYVRK